MTDLPSNLSYGKIVGRILIAVEDSDDADSLPDGQAPPAGSTITFKPNVTRLLNTQSSPPTTILTKTVTGTFDEQGYIRDNQGNMGVWLLATDDDSVTPVDWSYLVTVSISGFSAQSYSIHVESGSEVDLTMVTPVEITGGTAIVQGPRGRSAYEVAVDNGFVGTVNDWLASLAGGGSGDANLIVGLTAPDSETGVDGNFFLNKSTGMIYGPKSPSTGWGSGTLIFGQSAYQIAVNNGFEGDEQEWLASLQGEPGTGGGGSVDLTGYARVRRYNPVNQVWEAKGSEDVSLFVADVYGAPDPPDAEPQDVVLKPSTSAPLLEDPADHTVRPNYPGKIIWTAPTSLSIPGDLEIV